MPLANQLDVSHLRFAPRFVHGFGTTPGLRLPRLRARYRCEFANAFSGAVELVMEPGSLAGDWSLRANFFSNVQNVPLQLEATARQPSS